MQDCNPEMGNKKEPSAQLTPKSSIQKFSNIVYHIIKPKGKNTMIELKITVNDAADLTKELTAVYKKVVGEPMDKVYPEVKAEEVKKEMKATDKAEPKVEEVPSIEKVRAAVKEACSSKEDKQELKAFLESIKLDKVSNANASQRLDIMEWVKSRG